MKSVKYFEAKTKAVPAPLTIGFRLDTDARSVLAGRAAQLGISPHGLARFYVIEALQDSEERTALREAIEQLRHEIVEDRKDIAVATEALLASAGKASPEEAHAWTKENLSAK